MKAIILAAGYATRLQPLTLTLAKPLLPLAGRPIIDYIYDKLVEVPEIEAVHVVTNHKFAAGFEGWAKGHRGRLPIVIHDDGTLSNDDRLGAIGDIRYTVEKAGLEGEDLLVTAGDNLFDYHLSDLVKFWREKGQSAAIALYQCPDMELVKQYSIVELDPSDRLTSFIEKPKNPTTNLVGTATYVYGKSAIELIGEYLSEGNSPDQPGNLVAWLHKRLPVYGYRFQGGWFDIGNHQELLTADNLMRERSNMPKRTQYSPT